MAAPDFLGADIQRKYKCMMEEVGKRIMRQNLWENKAKIFLDNSYYSYCLRWYQYDKYDTVNYTEAHCALKKQKQGGRIRLGKTSWGAEREIVWGAFGLPVFCCSPSYCTLQLNWKWLYYGSWKGGRSFRKSSKLESAENLSCLIDFTLLTWFFFSLIMLCGITT